MRINLQRVDHLNCLRRNQEQNRIWWISCMGLYTQGCKCVLVTKKYTMSYHFHRASTVSSTRWKGRDIREKTCWRHSIQVCYIYQRTKNNISCRNGFGVSLNVFSVITPRATQRCLPLKRKRTWRTLWRMKRQSQVPLLEARPLEEIHWNITSFLLGADKWIGRFAVTISRSENTTSLRTNAISPFLFVWKYRW